MKLFGHPLIPSERFYHIESLDAIAKTPSNTVIALFFSPQNLDLIVYLRANKIRFALYVTSTVEAVLAENMNAHYLLVHPKIASEVQKVADHYMFDAKVLGYIEQEDQLEKLIEMRLDGAVFIEAIVKVTS
jgi:hypothetical protein